MKHPIRLDPNHLYWSPGPTKKSKEIRRYGFSEICVAMGVTRPNPFHTSEGRAEGVALHKWFIFLASGKAPKTHPDERIAGRVEGIKLFLADRPFDLKGGEEPHYDPETNTACMPDAWGFRGPWSWVIDAKRGAKEKYHALQTACQQIVLRANGFHAQKRGSLYLRDGGFRLIEHTDLLDIPRWYSIALGFHAMTPAERAAFAVAATPADLPCSEHARIIQNAFAARSFYL